MDGSDDGGEDTNDGGVSLVAGSSELARSNTPLKKGSNSSSSAVTTRHTRMTDVKAIKQTQEEMKLEQDKRHEELKKELKQSHDQMKALQSQLAELTATLNSLAGK
jgi:chromosome segregation ATPase